MASTINSKHSKGTNRSVIYCLVFFCLFITIQYSNAQCYLERHNTTWYDGWTSCQKKASPNPSRGTSHWLMYSLGHRYALGESYFWNHNVPTSLHNGAKEIAIDYSLDGITWTNFGNYSLDQASGENIYEGQVGPNFQSVEARYVLITVLETYGGSCAGISEVKINVSLSTAADDDVAYNQCMSSYIYPNPVANFINVNVNSVCGQKSSIFLSDASGRRVSNVYTLESGNQTVTIPARDLPSGIYIVHIQNGDKLVQERVVKVE